MNSLSIICFVYNIQNRGVYRARNFLYSLREQTSPIVPEIIIVDMSTDDTSDLNVFAHTYGAFYIRSASKGDWNKSLALNIGLRYANSEYCMFTDIDYVFAPNFIETASKHADPSNFLICLTHDSLESVRFDHFHMIVYEAIRSQSKLHSSVGDGACQLTTTEWFKKVGGYDERMKLWGSMDNDIVVRAKRDGLCIKQISPKTSIVHQWHKPIKLARKYEKQFASNIKFLQSKDVIRNPGGWGRVQGLSICDYRQMI